MELPVQWRGRMDAQFPERPTLPGLQYYPARDEVYSIALVDDVLADVGTPRSRPQRRTWGDGGQACQARFQERAVAKRRCHN